MTTGAHSFFILYFQDIKITRTDLKVIRTLLTASSQEEAEAQNDQE